MVQVQFDGKRWIVSGGGPNTVYPSKQAAVAEARLRRLKEQGIRFGAPVPLERSTRKD